MKIRSTTGELLRLKPAESIALRAHRVRFGGHGPASPTELKLAVRLYEARRRINRAGIKTENGPRRGSSETR
jgi:hypothetical protein